MLYLMSMTHSPEKCPGVATPSPFTFRGVCFQLAYIWVKYEVAICGPRNAVGGFFV